MCLDNDSIITGFDPANDSIVFRGATAPASFDAASLIASSGIDIVSSNFDNNTVIYFSPDASGSSSTLTIEGVTDGDLSSITISSEAGDADTGKSSPASLPFAQRLAQARMEAGQTPEGMAMLLGVSEDYYLLLEENTQPDDDLLRRICGLFHWNYNEVLQKLRTHNHPLYSTTRPPLSFDEMRMDEVSGSFPELPEIQAPQPLNQRIRQAREEVSQSIEGLALLYNLILSIMKKWSLEKSLRMKNY